MLKRSLRLGTGALPSRMGSVVKATVKGPAAWHQKSLVGETNGKLEVFAKSLQRSFFANYIYSCNLFFFPGFPECCFQILCPFVFGETTFFAELA